MIRTYSQVIRAEKLIIGLLFKQGCILKKFKEVKKIFKTVGLSRYTSFFKIKVYKFVKNYQHLKHSTLSVHYLKNSSKNTRSVCKKGMNLCNFFLSFFLFFLFFFSLRNFFLYEKLWVWFMKNLLWVWKTLLLTYLKKYRYMFAFLKKMLSW